MKKISLIILISLLSACATQKHWTATGGSRSDGIVKLSYEYTMLEQPVITLNEGIPLARRRCASWGYNNAEAFGGTQRNCNQYGSSGCNRWIVTAEYQCTNTASTPTRRAQSQQNTLSPALPATNKNPAFNQALKPGKGYYNAEKIAKTLDCNIPLDILKNEQQVEVYQSACPNGQALLIKCEWGNCKAVH